MELLTLFIAVILFAVIVSAVVVITLRQRSGRDAELLQVQMQQIVQQGLQQNLQTLLQQMNQQQRSQEHSAGQLHNRVSETGQAIAHLQAKLAQLEEGNKRILDMSRGITELQNILQAPKLRGERGEMWLEELLAQMIPRNNFKMQHHFKSGEICDAVIFLRDNLLLPIDSKFSLENFKKMLATEEAAEQKQYEKLFTSDVKKRIDEIAKKYILPAENTLNFAFMYIPAENVYYQAFVEDRGQNQLQRYAYDRHVIPVSPNSLYPYLEIVMFGLRGLEIEQSAKQIHQQLTGLQTEFGKFRDLYGKVGSHLRNAQSSYELTERKLVGIEGHFASINHNDPLVTLEDGNSTPE